MLPYYFLRESVMRQTMMIVGGVLTFTTSLVSFAGQCMSTETFAIDSAALQNQITQNCTGETAYAVGDLYPNSISPDGVVIYVNTATRTGIAVALQDAVSPDPGVSWENELGGGPSDLGFNAENPIDPLNSMQQTTTAIYYLYNPNPGAYYTTGITAGQANTSTILSADYTRCATATGATGCAAYAAATYTGGYAGHTGTDTPGTWYLPSVTEMYLAEQYDSGFIGPAHPNQYTSLLLTGTYGYWSSTEVATAHDFAFQLYRDNTTGINYSNAATKVSQFGVRAVRAFNY